METKLDAIEDICDNNFNICDIREIQYLMLMYTDSKSLLTPFTD